VIHVLISALYKLFIWMFTKLPSSLTLFFSSSFLMLSFVLIYFLTCLLPDLSIYSFLNRLVSRLEVLS